MDEAGDTVSDDSSTPPDEAIRREEAAIVRRALGALPETYREPVVLFYREGQSVRNVAEALDVSKTRSGNACRAGEACSATNLRPSSNVPWNEPSRAQFLRWQSWHRFPASPGRRRPQALQLRQ